MKFGKRLLAIAAKNEAFAPYFLDYKCLKKLVKRVGDHGRDENPPVEAEQMDENEKLDAEEVFMLALEGEFAKVESFFRRVSAEQCLVFRSLCKRFAKVQCVSAQPIILSELSSSCLEGLHARPVEQALLADLFRLTEEVDALRGFVMTNAQALMKICKKHDKLSAIKIKAHFTRVLQRCTFYNSREFGGLVADLAVLAQEIWKHMSGMPVRKEDAFVCEICSHVLCNPLVLSCGHRFCNSCVDIAAGFFSLHQCPSCSETCVLSEEYMRVYSISNHVKGILLLAGAPAAARGAASAPVTAWSGDVSSGPGAEGAEVGGAGLLGCGMGDGLPRNKSASALSRACVSAAEKERRMSRNHSDSELGSRAAAACSPAVHPGAATCALTGESAGPQEPCPTCQPCTLLAPCAACVQRSVHVRILGREAAGGTSPCGSLAAQQSLGPAMEDGERGLLGDGATPRRRLLLERILRENEEATQAEHGERAVEQVCACLRACVGK